NREVKTVSADCTVRQRSTELTPNAGGWESKSSLPSADGLKLHSFTGIEFFYVLNLPESLPDRQV
ncbi:MAG: hypothetical protein Q8K69_03200, partial [Bacteroidota bacterium]|nr:hypothetical protein [Bacteroidota bacterium]